MSPLLPPDSDGSPSHTVWLHGVPPPNVQVAPKLSENEKPLFAAMTTCCPSLVAISSSPRPDCTSLSALSDGVSRSTTNGHTFTFRGLSATCPGTTGCTLADQEHIAADRNNPATGGDDRVYSVWRDFAPSFSIRISCSADGGTTWTSGIAIGAGDLPRVSVGGDGFVYAAWPSGGNMMLHKFSNCDAGLTPQVGW